MKTGIRLVMLVAVAAALLAGVGIWRRTPAPPVPVATPPPASPGALVQALPDPVVSMEQLAIRLTNEQRAQAGLAPLDPDPGLSAAARSHSEDMLRRQFFDHVNPDHESPQDRAARLTGSPVFGVGENIWMWSGAVVPAREALVRQAIGEWMASAAHRENLLRPGYRRIGAGVAVEDGQVRVTAVFSE